MKKDYTINKGQAATELGVSIHHFQKMLDQNLVPVEERSKGGKPRFNPKLIKKMKKEINEKYALWQQSQPAVERKPSQTKKEIITKSFQPSLLDGLTTDEKVDALSMKVDAFMKLWVDAWDLRLEEIKPTKGSRELSKKIKEFKDVHFELNKHTVIHTPNK